MNAAKMGNHNLFILLYAKGKGSCWSSMVTCCHGWTILIFFRDDLLSPVLFSGFDTEHGVNKCLWPDPC